MKKLNVEDKAQIKQLLYCKYVLGLKNDLYSSFNGFQLWWYDREHDVCYCCESGWSDVRKKVKQHSLDKAAKILWRNRRSLFMRSRNLAEDRKLVTLSCLENARTREVRGSTWMRPAFSGRLAW
jgi:hypothetical protein